MVTARTPTDEGPGGHGAAAGLGTITLEVMARIPGP